MSLVSKQFTDYTSGDVMTYPAAAINYSNIGQPVYNHQRFDCGSEDETYKSYFLHQQLQPQQLQQYSVTCGSRLQTAQQQDADVFMYDGIVNRITSSGRHVNSADDCAATSNKLSQLVPRPSFYDDQRHISTDVRPSKVDSPQQSCDAATSCDSVPSPTNSTNGLGLNGVELLTSAGDGSATVIYPWMKRRHHSTTGK
jgi:hypothetical protein